MERFIYTATLESANAGHVRGDQYPVQPSDVNINRLISGADEK